MTVTDVITSLLIPAVITLVSNLVLVKARQKKHRADVELAFAEAHKVRAEAATILVEPLKDRIRELERRVTQLEAENALLHKELEDCLSRE